MEVGNTITSPEDVLRVKNLLYLRFSSGSGLVALTQALKRKAKDRPFRMVELSCPILEDCPDWTTEPAWELLKAVASLEPQQIHLKSLSSFPLSALQLLCHPTREEAVEQLVISNVSFYIKRRLPEWELEPFSVRPERGVGQSVGSLVMNLVGAEDAKQDEKGYGVKRLIVYLNDDDTNLMSLASMLLSSTALRNNVQFVTIVDYHQAKKEFWLLHHARNFLTAIVTLRPEAIEINARSRPFPIEVFMSILHLQQTNSSRLREITLHRVKPLHFFKHDGYYEYDSTVLTNQKVRSLIEKALETNYTLEKLSVENHLKDVIKLSPQTELYLDLNKGGRRRYMLEDVEWI